jgi:hypothetical protein
LSYFSYNTFGVCFANSNLFAVKEKLEIVSGAASPPAFLAGVLPRRRRGGFALIQVSCMTKRKTPGVATWSLSRGFSTTVQG